MIWYKMRFYLATRISQIWAWFQGEPVKMSTFPQKKAVKKKLNKKIWRPDWIVLLPFILLTVLESIQKCTKNVSYQLRKCDNSKMLHIKMFSLEENDRKWL